MMGDGWVDGWGDCMVSYEWRKERWEGYVVSTSSICEFSVPL